MTRQQSPGGESRCRVLRWRGGSRALARIESVRRRDLDRPRRSELRVDERNVWWLDRRGGWTAAVALRAVCDEVDGEAAPSAITVNFVGRVEPGSDLLIQTRRVGGGRSVSYWQSEVTADDVTLAIASVVLTQRRETDGHLEIKAPDAPDPDTLEVTYPAPGPWGERAPVRPIFGLPPHNRESTYSTAWVCETSGRSVDHVQLALLADHRAPRSFFWSDGPRPSSTLTLSVYFHATESELAAVGDDVILSEAFGTSGAHSTSEEHLRLWSRHDRSRSTAYAKSPERSTGPPRLGGPRRTSRDFRLDPHPLGDAAPQSASQPRANICGVRAIVTAFAAKHSATDPAHCSGPGRGCRVLGMGRYVGDPPARSRCR